MLGLSGEVSAGAFLLTGLTFWQSRQWFPRFLCVQGHRAQGHRTLLLLSVAFCTLAAITVGRSIVERRLNPLWCALCAFLHSVVVERPFDASWISALIELGIVDFVDGFTVHMSGCVSGLVETLRVEVTQVPSRTV